MDIFTHLAIGAAASSPFWATHPLESVAFTLGSVLPDLDALSRQFGRVAYLRTHQTWTHAIVVQAAVIAVGVAVLLVADLAYFVPSLVVLGLGMVVHSLLDYTNTYGVKVFAPFDGSRRSLEWVFFIDAFVIVSTAGALALQGWLFMTGVAASPILAAVWSLSLASYLVAKACLRKRAGRKHPRATSLVPSALWPTRFYALELDGDTATTSTIEALSGRIWAQEQYRLGSVEGLEALAEFRAMRELSEGFVVTSERAGQRVCRDLRTRNFGTNFGRLVVKGSGERLEVEQFDV